jgi:hypothetical protein
MNRNRLISIPLLCVLIGIGLFVSYSAIESLSSAAQPPATPLAKPAKEIAGYQSWSKANQEPVRMADRVALLCSAPSSPTAARINGEQNPHTNKYITVYVNNIGRQAMLEEKNPAFPEGSVIVKEKLAERSSPSAELLTVMIKHGKGFNPDSGDWEFMVVDGAGTTVQARGKLESCQACHTAQPKTDYVFRTYLSNEAMNKLK